MSFPELSGNHRQQLDLRSTKDNPSKLLQWLPATSQSFESAHPSRERQTSIRVSSFSHPSPPWLRARPAMHSDATSAHHLHASLPINDVSSMSPLAAGARRGGLTTQPASSGKARTRSHVLEAEMSEWEYWGESPPHRPTRAAALSRSAPSACGWEKGRGRTSLESRTLTRAMRARGWSSGEKGCPADAVARDSGTMYHSSDSSSQIDEGSSTPSLSQLSPCSSLPPASPSSPLPPSVPPPVTSRARFRCHKIFCTECAFDA